MQKAGNQIKIVLKQSVTKTNLIAHFQAIDKSYFKSHTELIIAQFRTNFQAILIGNEKEAIKFEDYVTTTVKITIGKSEL